MSAAPRVPRTIAEPDQLSFSLWRSNRRWRTAALALAAINLLLLAAALPGAFAIRELRATDRGIEQRLADHLHSYAATCGETLDFMKRVDRDLETSTADVAALQQSLRSARLDTPTTETFARQEELRVTKAQLMALGREVSDLGADLEALRRNVSAITAPSAHTNGAISDLDQRVSQLQLKMTLVVATLQELTKH